MQTNKIAQVRTEIIKRVDARIADGWRLSVDSFCSDAQKIGCLLGVCHSDPTQALGDIGNKRIAVELGITVEEACALEAGFCNWDDIYCRPRPRQRPEYYTLGFEFREHYRKHFV